MQLSFACLKRGLDCFLHTSIANRRVRTQRCHQHGVQAWQRFMLLLYLQISVQLGPYTSSNILAGLFTVSS